MGAAQSTRKITLVDDDKAGVIKLSESLAHRLRGQLEGQQAAAAAAQKASPAAVQEPFQSALPPPSPQSPLPAPPLSFIEKPLPVVPEPPRILDVVPKPEPPKVPDLLIPEPLKVPEPPKVPELAPIPDVPEPVLIEPPEPISSEGLPGEVTSEPPPPPSLGECLPSDSVVIVDPPLPLVAEITCEETSLSDQSLSPVETAQSEQQPLDEVVSLISEPKESVETEVSESEIPASSAELVDTEVSESEIPASAAESVAFPADSAIAVTAPVVENTSVVADAEAIAVACSGIEVLLPPPEALLSAAFANDAIETAASPPPAAAAGVTLARSLQVENAPPVPSSVTELPAAPDVGVAIKAGPAPTLSQPAGSIPPWSIYAEEAHLMVMRLREEKEQEIKQLNHDWRDKMDVREKEFVKMARLSEEQVTSALQEVESLFMKASCSPVCQNQQEAVKTCYQDHPCQSLRCAREVEHFTQCVDLSRLQSIMKEAAH